MKNENTVTRSIKYNKDIFVENNVKEDLEEQKGISPRTKKFLIFILLFFIAIVIYSCIICPAIFVVKEYKVESNILPESFHGIKIVQFSDVHYGTTINKKQLDKIVGKINDLKPDIIFFTGDLIDKGISTTEEIENEIIDSLSKLNCSLYKYAIYGNEDVVNDKYKDIITKADFKLLDNESTLLYYKENTPILITGFNSIETNPNYSILTNLVDEVDTANFYKIVLSHEPDSIDNFNIYNPNLVLSGHSLGGLVRIYSGKPLFLKDGSKKYYDDYYNIDNTHLFVSNGLGTSGINARFNNNPSISLYRLYKTKESN